MTERDMERLSPSFCFCSGLHPIVKLMKKTTFLPVLVLAMAGLCVAQAKSPAPRTSVKKPADTAVQKQRARKAFVLNVVNSAVALPQPDPQDRLRVLNSAASVVAAVQPETAKSLAKEGARIESDIIASGSQPAVSILSGGQVDCSTMADFMDRIAPASL